MKHAIAALIILATSLALLAGCRAPVGVRAAGLRVGAVQHVVICWLKTPGNAEARQKLIDASESFRQIPGVLDVRCGVAVPSTRPVVDSTYDVGIVLTFDSPESLKNYDTNPIHLAAAREVLKPLVAKYLIYDFQK